MYIVTGGAGFIGSAIIWHLNSLGIDNILVVDNLATTEKWKNLVNLRFSEYLHRDDFAARMEEEHLPWPVRGVFHMGACSSTTERDADFLMRNNLEFSKKLCRHALAQKARFITASSAATYGDGSLGFSDDPELIPHLIPLNMYGYSKQLFDVWLLRHGLDTHVASLKFFNVYGPNEYHKDSMRSVVNKSYEQICASGEVKLFRSGHPEYADGGQMRDFVYVKDCVAIMQWLLETPTVNGIYNVGTGIARTWNDLVKAVFMAMQKPVHISYIDMPEELQGKYQNYTEASMARLQKAGCPVAITSLELGVRDYVQNYLMQQNSYLKLESRQGIVPTV